MPTEKPARMLNVNQVADLLNVSTKTVRRMIEEREIHHHRIGRIIRVSDEDLRAFINRTRE